MRTGRQIDEIVLREQTWVIPVEMQRESGISEVRDRPPPNSAHGAVS